MRTPTAMVTVALVAAIVTALLVIATATRGESPPPFDRDPSGYGHS